MTTATDIKTPILAALQDPQWDYRTTAGIAKETGLSHDVVQEFLDSHPQLVWVSGIPDRQGRSVYTAQSRSAKSKEIWRALSTYIKKQTP